MFILCFLLFVTCISTMSTKNITVKQLKAILDEKLEPLKLNICDLQEKLGEAMKFLDLANANYEEVLHKLDVQEAERKELIAENKILKSTIHSMEKKMSQIYDKYNDMEQYSRRECLEIHGIPQPQDPKSENTNDVVLRVGKLMGVNLSQEDISVSHRLPTSTKYKGKRSEPLIIVKFVRRDMKEKFYRARKQLKGFTTHDIGYHVSRNIYINESLTEINKELFRACLKAKRELQYTYIWTSNGNIFLRKDEHSDVISIKKKDDIARKLQSG